jgi:diacylglycerol O-acyltransferase / wax synthase
MAGAIKLTSMDSMFLHMETPEMPMHVGSIALFQPAPDYRGDFFEDFKAQVASRLHLAPGLQRKLARPLLDIDNPSWVDDEAFDINRHIFRAALPEPRDQASLNRLVGWMHAKLLNRARPLWEMYVFDDLPDGQVGLYSKLHHAMIDGGAGVALSKIIYDFSATPKPPKPPKPGEENAAPKRKRDIAAEAIDAYAQVWARPMTGAEKSPVILPRSGKSDLGSVLFDHAMMQTETALKLITNLPQVARTVADVAGGLLKPEVLSRLPGMIPPKTPLGRSISSERSFATLHMKLKRVKAVGKPVGAKLNDVVLCLCSGALRRWMEEQGTLPEKSMTAAVPISLREDGNADTNNQVFATTFSLCSNIADPRARLEAIMVEGAAAKAMINPLKDVIPHVQHISMLGAPMGMQVMALLYSRSNLADVMPMAANVIISNVPGAPMSLYAAGAELQHLYPVSIPTHGMALNITVQSYRDELDFGLIAGANVLNDAELARIAGYLREELGIMEEAIGV